MADNHQTQTIEARRVLVPVANPATARGLIHLAGHLADPEHGRVLALFVQVSGSEPDSETVDELADVVVQVNDEHPPIELVTRTAPNVARGILDAALEHGVTLMVLGFQAPARGRVELGSIVESVARTTPCDLVVYRNPGHAGPRLEGVRRIVMPLDGSENARVAARLGVALGEVYRATPTAIHVQTDPDLPSWFGLARIEASLAELNSTEGVQRQVVRAVDVADGILARTDRNDVIVLGFSERSPLDRWIYGNVAQRILRHAPGPVILAKRAAARNPSLGERVTQRWLRRFVPTLTPSERTDVLRMAHEMSVPGINFVVLMFLSAMLASFGLLQSSAAVIIGAMLVAPLMAPLMAFSVGLLRGDLRLMRAAALTTVLGVAIGLAVAIVGGLVMPADLVTPEMVGRSRPSLLDMGVALASGAAGAYAVARRDIPAALAGVAIAAALVPPLCTVGLAIAFGRFTLASGAGLLLLTNIVSISLIGAIVFAWLGLRPGRAIATRRQIVIAIIVLGLLAIPLASTFIDVTRTDRDTSTVQQVLQDYFSDGDVISVDLTGNRVRATVRSASEITPADVRSAQQQIQEALDRKVNLEITFWRSFIPDQSAEELGQ